MENLLPKNNILLLKDDVGKAKPAAFRLPQFGHSYGKPEDRSQEGVGAITSTWSTHNKSSWKKDEIPRDFKKINKIGATNAKVI